MIKSKRGFICIDTKQRAVAAIERKKTKKRKKGMECFDFVSARLLRTRNTFQNQLELNMAFCMLSTRQQRLENDMAGKEIYRKKACCKKAFGIEFNKLFSLT